MNTYLSNVERDVSRAISQNKGWALWILIDDFLRSQWHIISRLENCYGISGRSEHFDWVQRELLIEWHNFYYGVIIIPTNHLPPMIGFQSLERIELTTVVHIAVDMGSAISETLTVFSWRKKPSREWVSLTASAIIGFSRPNKHTMRPFLGRFGW